MYVMIKPKDRRTDISICWYHELAYNVYEVIPTTDTRSYKVIVSDDKQQVRVKTIRKEDCVEVKPFKVVIVKADSIRWYRNLIGHVIDVIDNPFSEGGYTYNVFRNNGNYLVNRTVLKEHVMKFPIDVSLDNFSLEELEEEVRRRKIPDPVDYPDFSDLREYVVNNIEDALQDEGAMNIYYKIIAEKAIAAIFGKDIWD